MIAGLRGRVFSKSADALFIDVSGVIYQVGTSAQTLGSVGDAGAEVQVLTRLIVREDQMALYGFLSLDELRLFDTLLGVTGVGPRLACAVLGRFPADQLYSVILEENATLLATVPGIGRRTAARLILELRGKLPALDGLTLRVPDGGAMTIPGRVTDDVVDALQSLGYSGQEIATAVAAIPNDVVGTENRMLAALRSLGRA